MNREEFQAVSRLRRKEAAALIKARHFAGGYYLMGYAVECALKACIAKRVVRHAFPPKDAHKLYIHDLPKLRELAGLASEMDLPANHQVQLNWSIVKDWSEEFRYETQIAPVVARDFYSACTARSYGVLTWIGQKW
jgi:hypothetical protein